MSHDQQVDYKKILSSERLRSSVLPSRTILTDSESDRGRVLFSPAFRRLQQKAQVFSMEPNAAVRSRLTHSLEVSQVGRYIADEIGERLKEIGQLDAQQQSAMVNFVETACLIHDIGNPPFGHFGEAAIQKWFQEKGGEALKAAVGEAEVSDVQRSQALADFEQFDGNPQGFRIVTRLQWNTDEFGLNLTKTSLASFLKYLRSPLQAEEGNFTKKAGFFVSEQALVHQVWKYFGYDTAKPQRFPLNYIMEAADDIAYCISDLEDSFEKDIIQEKSTFEKIKSQYESNFPKHESSDEHKNIMIALNNIASGKKDDGSLYTYTDFRTNLNRIIIKYVAKMYVEKEAEIAMGTLKTLLPEKEAPGAILKALRDYCRQHVYSHESVQHIELAGYSAIYGLLDNFECLLKLSRQDFFDVLNNNRLTISKKKLVIEPKLLSLFPERQKRVYKHLLDNGSHGIDENIWEWNIRAHLVVDFISGMTDDYAMTTFRTLAGMRL